MGLWPSGVGNRLPEFAPMRFRKGHLMTNTCQLFSNLARQAWPCNCDCDGSHGGDAGDRVWPAIGGKGVLVITVLVVLLVLMLIGSVPTWPHSQNWGYAPSGTLGLVLVVLVVLLLTGRL